MVSWLPSRPTPLQTCGARGETYDFPHAASESSSEFKFRQLANGGSGMDETVTGPRLSGGR